MEVDGFLVDGEAAQDFDLCVVEQAHLKGIVHHFADVGKDFWGDGDDFDGCGGSVVFRLFLGPVIGRHSAENRKKRGEWKAPSQRGKQHPNSEGGVIGFGGGALARRFGDIGAWASKAFAQFVKLRFERWHGAIALIGLCHLIKAFVRTEVLI